MKNVNRSFPFGLRQLGRVGHGKSYAAAQAMGGGSVVLNGGNGGSHSMKIEAEHEQIYTLGSANPQTIVRCATATCDCGWTGMWSSMQEANAAAQDHLMGSVENHLVDVPFTPRQIEDARVVNGTIKNLLAD